MTLTKVRYEVQLAHKITGKPLQVIDEAFVLIGRKEQACMVCGDPTRFIDLCSEGHLCSKECDIKWYDMFNQHSERSERQYDIK